MADDYILRQIHGMGELAGNMISGKDPQKEQHIPEAFEKSGDVGTDLDKRILLNELEKGNVNEAETNLFESLQNNTFAESESVVKWFYQTLREWPTERLEAAGFSPEEVESGEIDAMLLVKKQQQS